MYVYMPKFSVYASSHTHIMHDMWLSESSSFIPLQWSPYYDYKMKMLLYRMGANIPLSAKNDSSSCKVKEIN